MAARSHGHDRASRVRDHNGRACLELAAWLTEAGCTHVAMEATGVYWKPVWHILEESFTLVLANAQHIRNVPGRKSDRNDAAWIADLLAHGLIRGSFVPPAPIQELRDQWDPESVPEVPTDEGLVDDGYRPRRRLIVIPEVPPPQQRHSVGCEPVGADRGGVDPAFLLGDVGRVRGIEHGSPGVRAQRRRERHGGMRHARDLPPRRANPVVPAQPLFGGDGVDGAERVRREPAARGSGRPPHRERPAS